MNLDFEKMCLAFLKEGKTPEDLLMDRVDNILEVHDYVTLYFVDNNAETLSVLNIVSVYPIDTNKMGVIEGEWELGG
ncbi:MAG: hypothetical protein ABIA21_00020 [Candidatus Aenigmatarchaeota archaeon]